MSRGERDVLWPALDRNAIVQHYAVETAAIAGYRGTVDAHVPEPYDLVIYFDSHYYFKSTAWGLTAPQAHDQRKTSNDAAINCGLNVLRLYEGDLDCNDAIDNELNDKLQKCLRNNNATLFMTTNHPDLNG